MRQFVVASAESTKMYSKAEKILKVSKELLDLLEDTDEDFLEKNDLKPLYDELIETVPDFQFIIRSKNLEF